MNSAPKVALNGLARFREGEPPGEPSVLLAQRELRPPGMTHDASGSICFKTSPSTGKGLDRFARLEGLSCLSTH